MKSFVEAPEGGKVTPFDDLMKNAESLLKSGKYMEAADAYQTAITTEPNNALAVIGSRRRNLAAGCTKRRQRFANGFRAEAGADGGALSDRGFYSVRSPELLDQGFGVPFHESRTREHGFIFVELYVLQHESNG